MPLTFLNNKVVENIFIKFQDKIDNVSKYYLTAFFIALTIVLKTFVGQDLKNVTGIMLISGPLLAGISGVWLVNIKYWNKMLVAELEYLKAFDKKTYEYNMFVKEKAISKSKNIYTHSFINIIPAFLFLLSLASLATFVLIHIFKFA